MLRTQLLIEPYRKHYSFGKSLFIPNCFVQLAWETVSLFGLSIKGLRARKLPV